MKRYLYKILSLLLILLCVVPMQAQKLIEYEAGIGSRDPGNADTWILYQGVRASHSGMILYADSALMDTKANSFTAFRKIRIVLSDTTTIYGDRLYYDGETKIADVWGKIVTLVDGKTVLTTDRLTFDRNSNTGYYETWGHVTHEYDTLDSKEGLYDVNQKIFVITNEVVMRDTSSRLLTDALVYNTETEIATFQSPTHIYSDSSHLYSEQGEYDSKIEVARSYRNSLVESGSRKMRCDTLFFNQAYEIAQAWGSVWIFDSANNMTCMGNYGETDQQARTSFVTDSALVIFVDKGDSLFLHADTILVKNNENKDIDTVKAHYGVRCYRRDAQMVCDSLFYTAIDSVARLYYDPVVWYDSFQLVADTMEVFLDSSGARLANLMGNMMGIQRVDFLHFNQLKGKEGVVHFEKGEPTYADITGSTQMVYYLTEMLADSSEALVGCNVGIGSSMRLFFKNRQAEKVTTFGKPDMTAYPPNSVPEDKRQLQGFEWKASLRPTGRDSVFGKKN